MIEEGIDWEELARQMDSGRTGFECFRRFQKFFNPDHCKQRWPKDDTEKLDNLITSSADGNITWRNFDELRLQFPGLDKRQIKA